MRVELEAEGMSAAVSEEEKFSVPPTVTFDGRAGLTELFEPAGFSTPRARLGWGSGHIARWIRLVLAKVLREMKKSMNMTMQTNAKRA